MGKLKKLKKAVVGLTLATMCVAAVPFPTTNGIGTVQAASSARQMEALSRGLVAVKTDSGVFLSWRLLGTESYSTKFNVYRDGVKIASNISDSTNFLDTSGSSSSSYMVRSVVNGSETTQSDAVKPWSNNYKDVPIQKPANTTLNGTTVTYSANDATVADVDGDGEYEIILKWDPSNSKDNSQSGYTSNVYVDCYEMDGTMRWRIDLGKNIRAGAHYTQIIAYDLNGDGKAEVAMKTADGTVAGDGTVIGDASKDYRNSSGYVLSGPEYLTLFEGKTGKVLTTIDYNPQRGKVSSWGDSYGNRVDRFLAGVAYFDGKTPSLVVCRGYYTRAVIVSYEYKGGKLVQEWVFDTNSSGNSAYAAQGNHNLSIADVDGDGKDEIVYGSAVIDNDGTGLYSTGQGHGDALHVGDFDPDRSGLEVYQVHETKSSSIESVQMRDAKSGKTIWSKKLSSDVGRGLIVNVGPDYYPYIALSSKGAYDSDGNQVTSNVTKFGINFASYWDGDLYREVLDKTYIDKWDWNNKKVVRVLTGSNVHSNNSTKATPSLSGDIMGDWREEVIWPTSDDKALRIYTTTDVTEAKLYTLMHDSQYRTAIAWQNVAYNQPPHTSYYIGPDMATPSQPSLYTVGSYTLPGISGEVVTPTATPAPTATPKPTVAPTATPVPTATPTVAPTATPKPGSSENTGTSAAWKFNGSEFTSLGTISSTVEVDDLTLIATSAKTMSVNSDKQTINGTTYTHALALGGGGNTSYRAVKIPVTGSDTIKVALRSSGTTTRTLVVADESGNKLGTMSAASTASVGTYEYSGDAGYVYLYSSGSGINLYMIQVDSENAGSSVVTPTATPAPTAAPTATPAPTAAPTAPPAPTVAPTATPVPTVAPTTAPSGVAYTGSVTIKGANWWASKDIAKSDLLGDVDPKAVTAIKFVGDTEFTVGYNGTSQYTQLSNQKEYNLTDVVLDNNYYLQVCLSKNDNVNYTFKWEIYTDSSSETPAPTATPVPTVAPTATPAPTVAPTATPAPTAAPTVTPAPTETPESGEGVAHNFTTDGVSSSFLTFSDKKNTSSGKGSYTYEGNELTTCLKVESSTQVSFTTTKANAKLIMVVQSKSSGSLKIAGPSNMTVDDLTTTVEVREITLGDAGTYTISKNKAENYIYYIEVVQ